MRFIQLLLQTQEHHVMVDLLKKLVHTTPIPILKHLQGGVAKGAFDEATAQARFSAWKENKQANLAAIKAKAEETKQAAVKERLEAEKKINEEIAKKVAEKKAAEAAAKAEAEAATAEETPAEEAPATEAPAEA